jgi:membrane peptidoglycan carboxypeptidase
MAGAYATLARMGVAIKPQLLRKIENNRGQIVEVFEQKVDKVFQVEPVANLVECMQGVVKFGTGTGAKLDDRPVAGKTGTADESKDIWFVGFTPDICTAVWGGNDENLPIAGHNVTGGDVMAKIWKHYMQAYYEAHPTPAGSFVAPTGALAEAKAANDAAAKKNEAPVEAKKPSIDISPVVVPVGNSVEGAGAPVPNGQSADASKPAADEKVKSEPVQLRPLPAALQAGPSGAPILPAGSGGSSGSGNYGGISPYNSAPSVQAQVMPAPAPAITPYNQQQQAPVYSPRGYAPGPSMQQTNNTIMMRMGENQPQPQAGGRLYPAPQTTRYSPAYQVPSTAMPQDR